MPRKLKLGRTGAKHQKPAEFDAHRQPKAAGAASRAQETLLAALEATHAAISAPSAADAATMPQPPAATSHPPLPANPLNLPSVRDRKRQRSLSERVRKLEADSRQFQEFRRALWERGSNDWCECSALGYFGSGHHFACPIYKCYAYEIGCCEGLWECDDGHGYLPCECMASGFQIDQIGMCPPPRPRERFRPDSRASEEGYWPRGCAFLDIENESRPCWGRSMKPCPRQCPCSQECGGRYVPVCPFRPHGVSGRPRGEVMAEMKGHRIELEYCHIFGEHLPCLPTS